MAEALDEPFELGAHRHAVTLSLGGSVGATRTPQTKS